MIRGHDLALYFSGSAGCPMSSFETSRPVIDYVPYFQQLITIQEKAIISFQRWAGVFVLAGLAIIGIALALNTNFQTLVSQITGIGGLFFGTVAAAVPYKEIAPRRARIASYVLLKQGFEKFAELCEEDRKRLRDLADDTIKRQV
jgi:hypothetical protein